MVDKSRQVLTRRSFLGLTAAGLAAVVAGCAPAAVPSPTAAPKPAETAKPAAPAATQAPKPMATPAPAATQAPVQAGAAKPFAGVTLHAAMYEHTFGNALKPYIPEFEQQTGMKVNFEMYGFAVYNQRSDLELGTKGSAYDVLSVTFIYAGRWIGAGWFTNLEDFIKDKNKTPSDWDPEDFPAGVMRVLKDAKGDRYGFPWNVEAMIGCAGRYDIIEKAGFKLPATFDDLLKLLPAIHDKEGVKAYTIHSNSHWLWIPFLMGYGGKVFKNPPENLTPMLDTPEAIQAADVYATIIRKYTPEGALSYTDEQMIQAQMQGRANVGLNSIPWHAMVGDPARSQVAKTAAYFPYPAGPKGAFPGLGVHGLGIPVGAKKKDASWEFIKWALSKDTLKKIVLEKGYPAPSRVSTGSIPEVKQKLTINGYNLADMYVKVCDLVDKGNYMVYRWTPVFPQAGTAINKAIQTIVTQQMSAEAAMKQAQSELVADIKKAGIKIDV